MIIGISGKIGTGKDTVAYIIMHLIARNKGNETSEWPNKEDYNSLVFKSEWQIKKFAYKLKQIVSILTGCKIEDLEDQKFKSRELGNEWLLHKKLKSYSELNAEQKSKANPNFTQFNVVEDWIPTYRWILQKLGTEVMREEIHENVWVNALFSDYTPDTSSTLEEDKRLLSIWKNMNTRCNNPNYLKYHKYGGKGITICKEWKDFEVFRIWSLLNGYTNNLTLDRRNTNGNYAPDNCRYVTTVLQAFNKNIYDSNLSNVKGVDISSNNPNKWRAQIQSKGIKENLGDYDLKEDAEKVYNKRYNEILLELEAESKLFQRNNYPQWIISDLRFNNELKAIEDRSGITIRINRPFKSNDDTINSIAIAMRAMNPEHPSETALDNAKFKYTINNNGTIEELIEKIREILIKEKII